MTSRKWVFTQFGELDALRSSNESWNSEAIQFATWQIEQCPESGKYHIQGTLQLKSSTRLTGVKKILSDSKIHLEKCINWEKSKEYCNKEQSRVEGPFTMGTEVSQGQRVDLESLCEMVREKRPMREIATANPVAWVRAYKGLGALYSMINPAVAIERKCALFWGETASGKTRAVYDNLADVYSVFCIKQPWFDNYVGQENVLFDECGPGMMNHNLLKRLLDRYPMDVPIKGGSVAWSAKRIVLTSNVPMHMWFSGITDMDYAALNRRVTIFKFPEDKSKAISWLTGEPEVIEVFSDIEVVPAKRARSSLEPEYWDLTQEQ